MKYNKKYSEAIPYTMVDATIMYSNKADNCYVCGNLTNFIDVDFEAHICSEECEDKLIGEFFHRALGRNN